MRKLESWTLISIIAVLVVIAAGSIVRATGSGLGCPDWPRCFGNWIPPTDSSQIAPHYLESGQQINLAKTWTEYINRLAGFVGGLILLYTVILSWRVSRGHRRVLKLITIAGLLYPLQAVQGGAVVKYHLDPRLVTVHFLLALGILGFLVHAWMLMRSRHVPAPDFGDSGRISPRRLRLWARLALLLTSTQLLLGALVRGSIELVAADRPDLMRPEWLPEVGAIDYIHREVSLAVTALVLLLTWRLYQSRCRDRALMRAAWGAASLIVLQMVAGLILAYGGLPAWTQVAHICLATWLITALFCQERLLSQACAGCTTKG